MQISPSALRAKQLRQSDKSFCSPSATSTSLRRVDRTTPVLVPVSDNQLPHSSTWTSEYDREYRPYERSRYHACAETAARCLHADLKPSTPRAYRSYLTTCWCRRDSSVFSVLRWIWSGLLALNPLKLMLYHLNTKNTSLVAHFIHSQRSICLVNHWVIKYLFVQISCVYEPFHFLGENMKSTILRKKT